MNAKYIAELLSDWACFQMLNAKWAIFDIFAIVIMTIWDVMRESGIDCGQISDKIDCLAELYAIFEHSD
jgi:hypothetical protein